MAAAETPNRVTILYDSFGKLPSLTMDWGFAALVEYGGKRILFLLRQRSPRETEPRIGVILYGTQHLLEGGR